MGRYPEINTRYEAKKAGSVIFRQNNLHIQDNIRIFAAEYF